MDRRGNDFFLGKHASPAYLRQLARELRANPTPAERKLWGRIRNRRLAGIKFRRQHILGRYIVDFFTYLHEAPLCGVVIEIDGRWHGMNSEYDAIRDEWMQAQSYLVLRFSNEAVLNEIESVQQSIVESVAQMHIIVSEEPLEVSQH